MGVQQKPFKQRTQVAPRGRPRKYSDESLVDAALRLMGRDGYRSLTIRALAGELGISHSALYTYVGAIEEIEDKAVHRLTDQLPLPTATSAPELRRQLIAYLQAARSLMKLHPGVVVSRTGSATSEIFREISEQWYRALLPYAPDLKTVQLALGALVGSVLVVVEGERRLGADAGRKSAKRVRRKATADLVPTQVVEQYLDDMIGLVLPALTPAAKRRKPTTRRSRAS